jgi:hypothetical protein
VTVVAGGWLNEGRRESDDETARHADLNVADCQELCWLNARQVFTVLVLSAGIRFLISEKSSMELSWAHADDAQTVFPANNNGTASPISPSPMGLRRSASRWDAAPDRIVEAGAEATTRVDRPDKVRLAGRSPFASLLEIAQVGRCPVSCGPVG